MKALFFCQTENTVEECNSGIKSKTINCSESDDGYSKSDENSSFNSAEVVLVECKSAASSSSGLESATSSCQLKDSPNEHSSEVVKKILVSNEVNEAIFKPGNVTFVQINGQFDQINVLFGCLFIVN